MKRRHLVNDAAFDAPLSDEALYWVGFILADGCLQQKEHGQRLFKLALAQTDVAHLYSLQKFLSASYPVHTCSTGAQFFVRSEQLVRSLERCGVSFQKSCREEAAQEVVLSPHFWRGVIDGDGCVSEKVVGKYTYPTLSLVSSTRLCSQFKEFLTSNNVPTKATATNKGNTAQIQLAGQSAFLAIQLLYQHCPISLERKQRTAEQLLVRYGLKYIKDNDLQCQ